MIAVVWNLAYNTLFERWEARQSVRGRSFQRRAAHAIGFELGLSLCLVPLFVWWLNIGLAPALVLDLGLSLFFLVYAICLQPRLRQVVRTAAVGPASGKSPMSNTSITRRVVRPPVGYKAVGQRWSMAQEARRLGLSGWVRTRLGGLTALDHRCDQVTRTSSAPSAGTPVRVAICTAEPAPLPLGVVVQGTGGGVVDQVVVAVDGAALGVGDEIRAGGARRGG